jgi:hypothetical protein
VVWRGAGADRTAPGERLAAAQQHAAASRAARNGRWLPSAQAFRLPAEADKRAAIQHERAAAVGSGDAEQHGRQAAAHRAAAVADIRQAERAHPCSAGKGADDSRGLDADQALQRAS